MTAKQKSDSQSQNEQLSQLGSGLPQPIGQLNLK